jgi:hypothetical protein
VRPAGQTGNRLAAKFEFQALLGDPGVASGSFTMKGYLFPGASSYTRAHGLSSRAGISWLTLPGHCPKLESSAERVSFCSTFSLKRI